MGFLLVPVRSQAALQAPEPNRQSGYDTENTSSLLEAFSTMLRSIALVDTFHVYVSAYHCVFEQR